MEKHEVLETDRGKTWGEPLDTLELSVLFPAYNEEAVIAEVVTEADNALRNTGYRYEVVVLDDASIDNTLPILQSLAERMTALRILRHQYNKGIIASLDDLMNHARGEWLFHNGADGQWKTAEVLRMMPLRERYDIIVGQRRERRDTLQRRFISWTFNGLSYLFFGIKTYDAGSIKLFPKRLLGDVRLISTSPFREAERLIRAALKGYRIGVMPVEHYSRSSGKGSGARLSLVLASILDLLRCWWQIVICRQR
jgi:glycosyltransferase involved in cell wall biosynthesis